MGIEAARVDLGQRYRWVILAVATLAQTSLALVTQGLPTLMPMLQADLHLTRTQVGLVISALKVGQGSSSLAAGWVTDAAGVRRTMPLGQGLMGLALVGLSWAGSYNLVLGVVWLLGLFASPINPGSTIAVIHWFPAALRGTAMSIKQTGVPIAGILAAAVLPSLAVAAGWRTAVVVLGVVVVATAGVSLLLYREASPAARRGWKASSDGGSLRALFLSPDILVACFFAAVLVTAQTALVTYLMLYLKEALFIPVVVAGGYLALVQFGGLVGRLAWGLASDVTFRGQRKGVLWLAGGLGAALVAVLGALPAAVPAWALVPLAFGLGFSVVGWHGVYHALIPELAGPKLASTGVGFSTTIMQVVALVGVPLFGYLADVTGSYRLSWWALATMMGGVTGLLFLLLREERRRM